MSRSQEPPPSNVSPAGSVQKSTSEAHGWNWCANVNAAVLHIDFWHAYRSSFHDLVVMDLRFVFHEVGAGAHVLCAALGNDLLVNMATK